MLLSTPMRRRCALIASHFCVILGVVFFATGCDEALKPWCTENRHAGRQVIAVATWPAPTAVTSSRLACATVNAWVCADDGTVVTGAQSAVVQLKDLAGRVDPCNVTMPMTWAHRCMGENQTQLTVWPAYPVFFGEYGCRLMFTRQDIASARVGFSLLLVPAFLFVWVCLVRMRKMKNTVAAVAVRA